MAKASSKSLLIAKILISLIFLFFIFKFKINLKDLIFAWGKINANLLFFAFAATAIVILIKAIKWQLLINLSLHSNITYKDSLISYLFGLGPALLTPGKIGEFFRITVIKNLSKIALAELFIIDKITEFIVIFLISSIGAYLLHYKTIAILCITIFLISVVIFSLRQQYILIIKKLIFKFSKRELIFDLGKITLSNFLIYTFLSGLSLFFDIVAFHFIINSFERLSFSHSLLIFPIILIAAVIPISISGLGARETAAIYLLGNFSISARASFNASLLIFFIGSVIPAIIGISMRWSEWVNR